MTDLIERVGSEFTPEPAQPTDTPVGKRSAPRNSTDRRPRFDRPLHVLLAVSAGGSAVLLFAMASGHLHGMQAVLATLGALVQVGLAIAVFAKPDRGLLWTGVAANIAIAALWVALANQHHAVSWTTAGIGIALSALIVILGAALALRPGLASSWSSDVSVIGSVLPVAVVALTIGGLFSTGAPKAPAPSSSSAATANTSGALAEQTTVRVPGENSKTFQSVVAGNDTEKSELKKFVPLDPHDQAILTSELNQAYQAAMEFPTVASAKAAGMILAGGMAPGVGAHYQNISGTVFKGINPDGSINAAYPASWIYASTANDAPVVGIMYIAMTKNAPSGFIGPNDHWHQHSNVCVQFSHGKIGIPFAADQNITPQECADAHGDFMKKTVWMVHAWVVPGWESPQGVFSHDNLHLYCPGNTDLTNAIGFCDRQS